MRGKKPANHISSDNDNLSSATLKKGRGRERKTRFSYSVYTYFFVLLLSRVFVYAYNSACVLFSSFSLAVLLFSILFWWWQRSQSACAHPFHTLQNRYISVFFSSSSSSFSPLRSSSSLYRHFVEYRIEWKIVWHRHHLRRNIPTIRHHIHIIINTDRQPGIIHFHLHLIIMIYLHPLDHLTVIHLQHPTILHISMGDLLHINRTGKKKKKQKKNPSRSSMCL